MTMTSAFGTLHPQHHNRAPAPNGHPYHMERKLKKPLMEKRRRARINHSLLELKSLLLQAAPHQRTKLEKADILEMTVQYLRQVNGRRQAIESAAIRQNYLEGYSQCIGAVAQYLGSQPMVADHARFELMNHLQGTLTERVKTLPPPPGPRPPPGHAPHPVAPLPPHQDLGHPLPPHSGHAISGPLSVAIPHLSANHNPAAASFNSASSAISANQNSQMLASQNPGRPQSFPSDLPTPPYGSSSSGGSRNEYRTNLSSSTSDNSPTSSGCGRRDSGAEYSAADSPMSSSGCSGSSSLSPISSIEGCGGLDSGNSPLKVSAASVWRPW